MSPHAIQIIVEFDKSLFGHFSVPQWNSFVADLLSKDLIPPICTPGERPHPVTVMLDFHGLRRAHYRLDGIDLRLCWLQDADFAGASLKGAQLGCGRNVSYRGARLHDADFKDIEISGCDFTDAIGLEVGMFVGATYDPANPPIGLSADILAACKTEADPPPSDHRAPCNPAEPTGFRQAFIRCHAVIHMIPMETL